MAQGRWARIDYNLAKENAIKSANFVVVSAFILLGIALLGSLFMIFQGFSINSEYSTEGEGTILIVAGLVNALVWVFFFGLARVIASIAQVLGTALTPDEE
jgi:hypothetical protein